jgi:hypothetical protein
MTDHDLLSLLAVLIYCRNGGTVDKAVDEAYEVAQAANRRLAERVPRPRPPDSDQSIVDVASLRPRRVFRSPPCEPDPAA